MIRGLYTAAAGMIAQQRRHDTVTNNIANINTPGFKQSNSVIRSFPEMLLSMVGGDAEPNNKLGKLGMGVFAEENLSVYLQADVTETSNPGDFALISNIQVKDQNGQNIAFDASGKYVSPDGQVRFQPQAFFTVLDPSGQERYTRDGKFSLNEQGQLVTSGGALVLGTNRQPIVLDRPLSEVSMTNRGAFTSALTGEPVADAATLQPIQLLISRVDDPNQLIREGNGNYKFRDDQGTVQPVGVADQVEVRQGYIERSNVDSGQSMVDLMAAARAYETNQKMIQFYDKTLEKAVNEVGRI